jgi:hypothetical protein
LAFLILPFLLFVWTFRFVALGEGNQSFQLLLRKPGFYLNAIFAVVDFPSQTATFSGSASLAVESKGQSPTKPPWQGLERQGWNLSMVDIETRIGGWSLAWEV